MKKILNNKWVMISGIGILAIALTVGVILLLTSDRPDQNPVSDSSTGIQMEVTGGESTEGFVQTTEGEETSAPDSTEETTIPEQTVEGTESTNATEETKSIDSTVPTQTQPSHDDGNGGNDTGDGVGFVDAPQFVPSTPTTPPATTAPAETTKPQETEPGPTETINPEKPVDEYTYEEYMALSDSAKAEFFYKFPSLSAFNQWFNTAKKAYDDEKVVIGDGSIDLGDFIGTEP